MKKFLIFLTIIFCSCMLNLEGKNKNPIDTRDNDGDGIPNYLDNCPDKINLSQSDFDNDTIGNACSDEQDDVDSDNDGVIDKKDWCITPNPSDTIQTSFGDTDCYGDVKDWNPEGNPPWQNLSGDCRQRDGVTNGDVDPIIDHCDNCPLVINPFQENDDIDEIDDIGNACEDPNKYSMLKYRLTRIESFDENTYNNISNLSDSWVELFQDTQWIVSEGFNQTGNGFLKYEFQSGANLKSGFAIAPNFYWSRLKRVSNHGVMALFKFDDDPETVAGPFFAGIIVKVDYNEGASYPDSFSFCGLGKDSDGNFLLVAKACDNINCDIISGNSNVPLPFSPLEGGSQNTYYLLQSTVEGSFFNCYLRNRVYHKGESDRNVIASSPNIAANQVSKPLIGLMASGISVSFKAVSIFTN